MRNIFKVERAIKNMQEAVPKVLPPLPDSLQSMDGSSIKRKYYKLVKYYGGKYDKHHRYFTR